MRWDSAISFTLFYAAIVIVCLLLKGFDAKRGNKNVFLLFYFVVIFFIAAFRDYNMGSDTKSYVAIFKGISKEKNAIHCIQNFSYEPLYVLLNWLISRVTTNPRFLFVIISIICGISLYSFSCQYVENVGLFCCLFVVLQFSFYTSAMRQSLSIAMILFAYRRLVKQKYISFLLLSFCAIGFHNSAWLFLIISPFLSVTRDKHFIFYALLIFATLICTIFSRQFLSLIFKIFPKYEHYGSGAYLDGEPRLATFLNFLVYFLLVIVPKLFSGNNRREQLTNTSINDCATIVPFVYLITSVATAFARFSAIFTIFTITNYSNSMLHVERKQRLIINIITIILFFIFGFVIALLKTPEWGTTYPILLNFNN